MAEVFAQFTADLFSVSLEEAKLGLGIFFTSVGFLLLFFATFIRYLIDIMSDPWITNT
jgi:hypothetical protein